MNDDRKSNDVRETAPRQEQTEVAGKVGTSTMRQLDGHEVKFVGGSSGGNGGTYCC